MPKETVSPFLRKVGARIKQVRESRDLSQAQLAERSGVDRAYLSGIERGIRNLTLLHLARLAKVLKVRAGSLLDD